MPQHTKSTVASSRHSRGRRKFGSASKNSQRGVRKTARAVAGGRGLIYTKWDRKMQNHVPATRGDHQELYSRRRARKSGVRQLLRELD